MRARRPGSVLCSTLLLLLPVFFTGSAALAAKAAKGAAKQKPGATSTEKKSSSDSSSSEVGSSSPAASSEQAGTKKEEASGSSASASSATPPPSSPPSPASSDLLPTASSGEPAKVEAPAQVPPEGTVPAPPAAAEEPKPVSEALPVWVEHLGPDSYPGKLRGLHGGSMWLEPSFHGLQWPYMARTGVGVSGSIWVDSGYERITRELQNPRLSRTEMWLQQGRGILRMTPTYVRGSFFIQGQIELVGNLCQVQGGGNICTEVGTFSTDDLWIRVGQWNLWDIKFGRFEGWELYHTGMGLDINTFERLGATNTAVTNAPDGLDAPQYYGANFLQYRPMAGQGIGYVALHAYPLSFLRMEVLGELGTDVTNQNTGHNYLGVRPMAILDLGWMKLKAGGEYERQTRGTPETNAVDSSNNPIIIESKYKVTRKGLGGSIQWIFDPWVEFGANVAMGSQTAFNDDGNPQNGGKLAFSRISVGGFANFRPVNRLLLGAGLNMTLNEDAYYLNNTKPDQTAHLQGFGAVQYLLAGQLFIKAVFGWSRADFTTSDTKYDVWSNYMYSGRLRLMYLY